MFDFDSEAINRVFSFSEYGLEGDFNGDGFPYGGF